MPDENPSAAVLALVRDLMFSGRIMAEARAAGVECKIVRDPQKLQEFSDAYRLLIVDLNLPEATAAAGQWRTKTNRPVVGFVSHVDADAIASGRAANLDQVLARSRFVQILPDLLRDGSIDKRP